MAKVSIEVLCIGHSNIDPVNNAICFLNKHQDSFEFTLLRDAACENFNGENISYFTTEEIYLFYKTRFEELKGYHPHIIGVVAKCLEGKKLSNLFGDMQEDSNTKRLTGKSIVSLWKIKEILHSIPTEVYLIFEFLSLSIRFVIGQGMIHEEKRMCIFDKKIHKLDIVTVLSKCKFCNSCEERIQKVLDNYQLIAISHIVSKINYISTSADPQEAFNKEMKILRKNMPKIFLSCSPKDRPFVEQLAKDLVNSNYRVWFDNWDIKIGYNDVEERNSGLLESDYLALVMSRDSVQSKDVLNEWSAFFKKKGKIIPILIDNCEIPPLLATRVSIDFRNKSKYKESFEKLLTCLAKDLKTPEIKSSNTPKQNCITPEIKSSNKPEQNCIFKFLSRICNRSIKKIVNILGAVIATVIATVISGIILKKYFP